MIDKAFADNFAAEWIEAWNARDLERVLSHYTDDFEMSSPVIVKIAGERAGTLKGKPAVRSYWTKALELIPHLHFELRATLMASTASRCTTMAIAAQSRKCFISIRTAR